MAPSQITRPGCPGRPPVSIILEAWSKQPLTANCRGQGRVCPAGVWATQSKLINCRFLHFSKHLNFWNYFKPSVKPCKRVQWRLWCGCSCWAVHASTVQAVISIFTSSPRRQPVNIVSSPWLSLFLFHNLSEDLHLHLKASFSTNICKLVKMLSGACWAVTGEDGGMHNLHILHVTAAVNSAKLPVCTLGRTGRN